MKLITFDFWNTLFLDQNEQRSEHEADGLCFRDAAELPSLP